MDLDITWPATTLPTALSAMVLRVHDATVFGAHVAGVCGSSAHLLRRVWRVMVTEPRELDERRELERELVAVRLLCERFVREDLDAMERGVSTSDSVSASMSLKVALKMSATFLNLGDSRRIRDTFMISKLFGIVPPPSISI